MQIRVGYELIYDCPQPTSLILTLHIHSTRVSDIVIPDHLITRPSLPITAYRDGFGNCCSRIVAPAGEIRLSADALPNDTGAPDGVATWAHQHAVQELPQETFDARATKTAWEALNERTRVCRDFTHLAIALCRCMNIPAR